MISTGSPPKKAAALLALMLCSFSVNAHTGHSTSSLFEGLVHPFGLDHMLAMLAVGVWSAACLPSNKAWWGPLAFMVALVAGAMLGAGGMTLPYLEHMVSLSVVVCGGMLLLARSQHPSSIGLMLVVVAGSMHGLAHGSEAPASGFTGYALGFLFTTAVLHFGGVLASVGLRKYMTDKAVRITQLLGGVFGGTGIYLFSQLP